VVGIDVDADVLRKAESKATQEKLPFFGGWCNRDLRSDFTTICPLL
jgi:hypothetical protein